MLLGRVRPVMRAIWLMWQLCRRRGISRGSRLFSGASVRLPRLLIVVKSKLRCEAPVVHDDGRQVIRSVIFRKANIVLLSVVLRRNRSCVVLLWVDDVPPCKSSVVLQPIGLLFFFFFDLRILPILFLPLLSAKSN